SAEPEISLLWFPLFFSETVSSSTPICPPRAFARFKTPAPLAGDSVSAHYPVQLTTRYFGPAISAESLRQTCRWRVVHQSLDPPKHPEVRGLVQPAQRLRAGVFQGRRNRKSARGMCHCFSSGSRCN